MKPWAGRLTPQETFSFGPRVAFSGENRGRFANHRRRRRNDFLAGQTNRERSGSRSPSRPDQATRGG